MVIGGNIIKDKNCMRTKKYKLKKYIYLINLARYCESINSDCSKCQHKTECDEFQFFLLKNMDMKMIKNP